MRIEPHKSGFACLSSSQQQNFSCDDISTKQALRLGHFLLKRKNHHTSPFWTPIQNTDPKKVFGCLSSIIRNK